MYLVLEEEGGEATVERIAYLLGRSINEILFMAEVENIKIVREKYSNQYITLLSLRECVLKNEGVKEVYSLIFSISSKERWCFYIGLQLLDIQACYGFTADSTSPFMNPHTST